MKKLLLLGLFLFAVVSASGGAALEGPIAVDDSFTTHGPILLPTGANDIGEGYAETEPAAYGTVSAATGIPPQHIYTPPTHFRGIDAFRYRYCWSDIFGQQQCSAWATVTIQVNNDDPVTLPDIFAFAGNAGQSIFMNVVGNDFSPDHDDFEIYPESVSGSTFYGEIARTTVDLNTEDGWVYTRNSNDPGFVGVEGFSYAIRERPNSFISNTSPVTILVIPKDDAEDAGSSCHSVGAPVNTTNGNMWLQERDFTLPGSVGESIDIYRTYNSILHDRSGLFGSGWSTQYDESIQFFSDERMLRVNMPDGKAVYFGRATNSEPFRSVSPDVHGQIAANQDGTYILTFKDGRSHKFDSGGTLLWQKDRNGNQTTLNRDTNGFLSSVTDSFGRTISLNKNTSNGKVSSIAYNSQTIATYNYISGTDRLQSVTYQDGSKYQFTYETVNGKTYLTTVKDALNNVLEDHDYDSEGRASTSLKDGGVESYTLDYSSPGKTRVTDGNGHVSYFHFTKTYGKNLVTKIEGLCGCGSGSEITQFEYDAQLNLAKRIDALGKITTYKYDNSGNPIELNFQTTHNGFPDAIKHKFTYNSLGQVLTYTDGMGGVTTNTYDLHGNLLTTTDPVDQTTTLTYNSYGQPVTVTDARGNTTTFIYDSLGHIDQITDANNETTDLDFDTRGRLISVTNAKNETTSFAYDARDRLKKITYPDSSFVTRNYDLAGRRISTIDEFGHATTYAYDSAYRLTGITDALSHTTAFGYDAMSNLTSQTDALGSTTDYHYDAFDRLDKVIFPAAAIGASRLYEEFVYNDVGNIAQKIDTAGRTTSYHYDDLHRVDYVTDALAHVTYFEYNKRFQVTKVKDALNQAYTFSYDALGRKLSQTRAGTTMSYEYDEVGNLKKRTDHNAQVTDYTYDALNRLTQIDYAGSSNYGTYRYDELSRLTSARNQNGTVTIGYTNRGRVNSTTDVHGNTVAYGYDAAGNRTRLELNGDAHASYKYDAANRLVTLTDESANDYIFAYDAANRLTTKTLPNNVVTSYNYDGMGRLTRLRHTNASATLFDNQYTYNLAGQISRIADLTKTRDFSYDDLDRLTGVSVSGNRVESYVYDAVGNRTSSHLNSFLYFEPFNRITDTDSFSYTHDLNGNRLGRTAYQDPGGIIAPSTDYTSHTWDEESRLIETTVAEDGQSVSAAYEYDALGRRAKRVVGLAETKFTYDGMDVVMDEDRSNRTTYQNAPGIDNKLKLDTGSYPNYFLQDHLGSTLALTKSSGSVVDSTAYDSFGNPSNPSFSTRYQFTGRERDDLSGLIYYRARWYDPKVGRFISEDPIGFAGGDINLYGYVWNNPQNFTDPIGLDGWGNDQADWLDGNIDYARNWYQGDVQNWGWNGSVNTVADLSQGFSDLLRVGSGTGYAAYDENASGWQRAGGVGSDVLRALGIAGFVGGGLSKVYAAISKFRGPAAVIDSCPVRVARPGRLGGPEHKAGVQSVVDDIKSRGLEPRKEVKVKTPNGAKPVRFADVGAYDSNNNLVELHQVGLQTKGGLPVARERQAIDDIIGGSGIRPLFHPYN